MSDSNDKKDARKKYIKRLFEYFCVFGATFMTPLLSNPHMPSTFFPEFFSALYEYPFITAFLFVIIFTIGYHVIFYIW